MEAGWRRQAAQVQHPCRAPGRKPYENEAENMRMKLKIL